MGNFSSPILIKDLELINISEVSNIGPIDSWPIRPSIVALKF